MAIGVEYGCKFILEGPDGSKAVFNEASDPNFVGTLDPENCSGLDRADVREDATDKTEDDGRIQGNNYYGGRPIVLGGTVIASTVISRNEKVDKILAAADAMRADATLTWFPQGGPVAGVSLKVRQNQPTRVTKRYVKEFQIALVANSIAVAGTSLKTVTRPRSEHVAKGQVVIGATAIATDATFIYYAMANDIWRSKLDGTESTKFIESAAASGGINGLAVNATHIFWADIGGGQIGRAKIDSTEKTQAFVTAPTTIRGIAINASNIFWGEASGAGSIGRATLAGGTPETEWLTTPSTGIKSVAVNATHIFWGQFQKMGRATIAGASPVEEWAGAGGSIEAIYADANFVYYGAETSAKGAIKRIKTDGTDDRYYIIFTEYGLVEGRVRGIYQRGNYVYHVSSSEKGGYAVDRTNITNKVEVVNEGTGEATPILKIYGQYLGTLELGNETDGNKKLVIPYGTGLPETPGNLDSEDLLEIDFANHTIKWTDVSKGVTTNVYSKLTFESSNWWKLKAGANIITTDSPFKLEVIYRDTYR